MNGIGTRRWVLRADPDVVLYAARVSVWARWLGWLVGVFELAYRPELWYATNKEYLFLSVPLLAFNGFVHYRLRRDRAVTWRWLLFLSGMDVALITAAVIIGGDFHLFGYVAYCPDRHDDSGLDRHVHGDTTSRHGQAAAGRAGTAETEPDRHACSAVPIRPPGMWRNTPGGGWPLAIPPLMLGPFLWWRRRRRRQQRESETLPLRDSEDRNGNTQS